MSLKNLTVVLVHGAWADGSSWAPVITALAQQGATVFATALPLTSLQDDVAALHRTLERCQGPVLLVGHAYAGAVIAEACSDKIRALVYVAALAPDEGETVADVFYLHPAHARAPKLLPDANGLVWLPEAAFGSAFAQHASAADQAWLAAVQRPIAVACITTPVSRPLWKDLPSWLLIAEDDYMLVPQTQQWMAERMQAQIRSHRVDHTPSVSAPGVVVDTVLEAALALATA